MSEQPIRLMAKDADDLAVVAACLQDALVLRTEMRYLKEESRFVMLVNRFRWEDGIGRDTAGRDANFADTTAAGGNQRINSGLCIDRVTSVRSQGLEGGRSGRFLSLITLGLDGPGKLNFLFSGEAAIQFEIEALSLFLQDFGEAWPTQWRPDHAGLQSATVGGSSGKGRRRR